jgi:uncharacterized protein (DUF2141 family)
MRLLLVFLIYSTCISSELEINLKDLPSNKGKIAIVIFNSELGFPDQTKSAKFKGFIPIKAFPYTVKLPKGEYAISLFHDENNNSIIDTNFIGIPKEAFGFSNDALGLMGPPSFKNAKFNALNNKNKINIKMKQF